MVPRRGSERAGNPPPAANYLFPESYCLYQERIDDQSQVSELDLPDGRSLRFKYNLYGEVAEVVLPTGGKLQYDYAPASGFPSGNTMDFEKAGQLNFLDGTDRAVIQRRTYSDGSTLESTWTYAFAPANCSSYPCVDVKAYSGDANGTLLLNQRHYFLQPFRYLYQDENSATGTGYSRWNTGLERRTETRDAAGNVISALERDWTQRTPVVWPSPYGSNAEQIANDNRVNETRRYLDTGSYAKTDTFYDNTNSPRANNVSEVQEFDFDQTLKRRTTTSYLTGSYQTDDSIHLLSLPLVQTVFDGNNNQKAQSVNEYDNYTDEGLNGNHRPLQDYGSVVGHDNTYNALKLTRGNLTGAGHWLNTTGVTIYSYSCYDTLGNLVSTKAPKWDPLESTCRHASLSIL